MHPNRNIYNNIFKPIKLEKKENYMKKQKHIIQKRNLVQQKIFFLKILFVNCKNSIIDNTLKTTNT